MKAAGLDIIEDAARRARGCGTPTGARYLDCFTSAGSFNVGRRNPRVVAAAHAAVDRLDNGNFLLCSRAQGASSPPSSREITPGDLCCTMFGTGGGEAVDFAIKLARGATGRPRIISTVNGYHGHTGLRALGRRPRLVPGPVRAADAGVHPGAVRRPRRARRGDRRAHRRRAAGADPGRGRDRRCRPPGYLAGVRARMRRRRRAADPRRDPDRPRPDGPLVGDASTTASCPTS